MDLRVRLLGLLSRRFSITRLDVDGIARAQARHPGHNRVVDFVFGGVTPGTEQEEIEVAGQVGPLPARVHRPARAEGPLPLVVDFHGGGWVLGDLDGVDWHCSSVAAAVGAVVVSVDYRLAPTHRWPAGPEDCYAALCDVVARAAELGADPDRVAVMGDSAGGNLAAVVALMARDRNGPRIAFQGLVYPATDSPCPARRSTRTRTRRC